MSAFRTDAPPPDLRIVPTDSLYPHEEHDSQRALPLIRRLEHESVVISPPIVSPMPEDQFVILDGANRYYAFSHLKYPHILVQVAPYDGGYVELKTWKHLVCDWDRDAFLKDLQQLPEIEVVIGTQKGAIAQIMFRDEYTLSVRASVNNIQEQNAALRKVVSIYQKKAVLHRTALTDPNDIWPLHPSAIAIVSFPEYQPHDIIAAALYKAFLPPGISRHIIHGRALRLNYPLSDLRDLQIDLAEKNAQLRSWTQHKLENRQVRYYAEATYQFDE